MHRSRRLESFPAVPPQLPKLTISNPIGELGGTVVIAIRGETDFPVIAEGDLTMLGLTDPSDAQHVAIADCIHV